MGQQQLLLVILVTIIVGIATLVAVNVLNSRLVQSNRDAVRQDLSSAASFVQSIWEKPLLMDGAARNFNNLNEDEILRFLNVPSSSYQNGDMQATNENGTYRIGSIEINKLTIIGEPVTGPPDFQIAVSRDDETGQWSFEISEVEE